MNVLLTGITGNFGYAVYRQLCEQTGIRIIAGTRNPERVNFFIENPEVEVRRFDLCDTNTFPTVLKEIDTVVLVRPSSVGDLKKCIYPFIDECRRQGVRHIVLLSLLKAAQSRWIPHGKVERYIRQSDIGFTFLRASFFMENLTTTHREEIQHESRLLVPAGSGLTNLVAVDDLAAVAVQCIRDKTHMNKVYELCGAGQLSYSEVADLLSDELDRRISYVSPGLWKFIRYRRRKGNTLSFILVLALTYRAVKKGRIKCASDTLQHTFGIVPRDLRSFIHENRDYFFL